MRILVTGGAGFIGSALVRRLYACTDASIVNIDKLTYAADAAAVGQAADSPRYRLERADVADPAAVGAIFARHAPDAVVHLAAETHVDRSIDGPMEFVRTNILGTAVMLEAARAHWQRLDADARARFRFVHVSTDEVFGSLGDDGLFDEQTPYRPSSPYSASKAGSDHLVRAWGHTYGIPVVVTNCSNNYGPHQYPDKLVPLMVQRALEGRALRIFGSGDQVRDWLHVDDHAAGIHLALTRGRPGGTYVFGGRSERRNLEVVHAICRLLDEFRPDPQVGPRTSLIRFAPDRAGHDWRYAVDSGLAERELGWTRGHTFEDGLRSTVEWYVQHGTWRTDAAAYRGGRLGLDHRAPSAPRAPDVAPPAPSRPSARSVARAVPRSVPRAVPQMAPGAAPGVA